MPQVKICPNCNKHNRPQDINCGCGYPLDNLDPVWVDENPAPSETEGLTDETTEAELRCVHPDCEAVNPGDSTNCRYCGRPLLRGY